MKKWFTLIGLSLLSFTVFLDYTIVTTALPFIKKDLNANVLQLQWVTNIFAMALSIFMIAAGKAGDLWGRKKVFYFAFVAFGVAAIAAANAHSIQWLIACRALQGFSAAIILTVGAALIPQTVAPEDHHQAIGIFSAINGAGLAIGPFLGGVLIALLNWRWVFWINIPIIIAGILLCAFTLKPDSRPDTKIKIDWLGVILLAIGLGCLIYGVILSEQVGWLNIWSWGNVVIGILAIILLLWVENKVKQPLLDLTIFKNKLIVLAILFCISAAFISYVFVFFDSLYLQLMRKQGALVTGLSLLAIPMMQVAISLMFPRLTYRFGVSNLLFYGLIISCFTGVLHMLFSPTISIFFILFTFILMGYTWGLANTGTLTVMSKSVSAEESGAAIGTVFTFWNLSGALALAVATVIFNRRETMTGFMSGFHWMAGFSSLMMLLILLIALKWRNPSK